MKRDTDLTACEHEILPHHDSEFVADIIEHIQFIDAPAPDTNHILVPGNQKLEPFHVLVVSQPTAMSVSRRTKIGCTDLVKKLSAGIQLDPTITGVSLRVVGSKAVTADLP